jgi:FkbM family methyltransferase
LLSQKTEQLIRTILPREARNWLRSPTKSIEWLWDSICFSVGVKKELTLLPGWALVCHPRVYKRFLQDQLTDPEQSAEFFSFATYCNSQMSLFDIGASYGVFSLTAAHFGGKAIAVEPSPIATRLLGVQAGLNGLTESIRILESCVSDTSGELDMLNAGIYSDGYFKIDKKRSSSELTKTRSVTVDQLSDQFGPPTHIKIDVEGHEGAVVIGARKTLNNYSPVLFFELHSDMIRADGNDPNSVLDALAEFNYEMYSIDGAKIDRAAILKLPICRLIGKRRQSA